MMNLNKINTSILFILLVVNILSCSKVVTNNNEIICDTKIPDNISELLPELPPDELNIISYNLFFLSELLNNIHFNSERAEEIGKWIRNSEFDIITFQETWDNKAMSKLLKEVKEDYPYCLISKPSAPIDKVMSGGLSIISKYPIIKSNSVIYENCSDEDCIAAKGAIHVLVQISKNSYINIVTTHLNAFNSSENIESRKLQILELNQFIANIDTTTGPLVITGDFNIDGIANDDEYKNLLKELNVSKYEISNPSTVNCDGNCFCVGSGINEQLDYIFIINEEKRLIRLETKHNDLSTSDINLLVNFLSDHKAVSAKFQTNY